MTQPLPARSWFEANLPEITSRARREFARLQPHEREEAVAEVLANVFQWCLSAARRGVLARITPFKCVHYAAKQFRIGRRVAGYSSTDVTSRATWAKGRAQVRCLSELTNDCRDRQDTSLSEALTDRREHDPFEQTRRKLDYPSILEREGVSAKAQAVFDLLAVERGTGSGLRIARRLGVSPGRVSQLKGELAEALGRHEYRPGMVGVA